MERQKAALALILLVPAPSLGVLAAMFWFPGTALGSGVFLASKIWLFGFPVLWRVAVERRPLSVSPVRKGGLGWGVGSGVVLSAFILLAYAWMGTNLIDRAMMADRLAEVGLTRWPAYLGGAAYWILVNSVLEEMVWRWFCVRQCEALMPRAAAVVSAAAFFTLHHVLALSVYLEPGAVAVCSVGVFTGGLVWSVLYARFRSIWPPYLSHALVDAAVFGIGAHLLFG